ncbi:hypothetical protein CDD83_8830 [Cordyceps sp. RAO-2017]|nr:hypothetical protein CDD83_8830 [Cordyceps sp. RAO-2017]
MIQRSRPRRTEPASSRLATTTDDPPWPCRRATTTCSSEEPETGAGDGRLSNWLLSPSQTHVCLVALCMPSIIVASSPASPSKPRTRLWPDRPRDERIMSHAPPPGLVLPFSSKAHAHLTPYLAAIHASCITHDRAIATFLPPLSHEKLLSWWKERIAEVNDGKRLIWILVSELDASARPRGPEVMGVVMLAMPYSETGPFRGLVEKLLVHKSFRGRGGARALMGALESDAAKLGRTVLLLDTETDSPAEAVCKKLGYIEMGRIPRYGMSPSGELKDGTFLYKHL